VQSFPLASMCPLIRTLTVFVLAVPVALLAAASFGARSLGLPALLMIVVYAWVWLAFRPSRFDVGREGLVAVFPLRRRALGRDEIASVRVIDRAELKKEIGWGLRVGAGGLWGGFGWLWTKRRGLVEMYVSRTDRFVWIERSRGRPWLVTPEREDAFVRALSGG